EEVGKVDPDLVVRDENGDIYTVRYEAVNAMLLNEFLKEHRKVQQLEKQVEALTAGLQRVTAEVELQKPSAQTVVNNQLRQSSLTNGPSRFTASRLFVLLRV